MTDVGTHSKPLNGTVTANGRALVPLPLSPLQPRGPVSPLQRQDDPGQSRTAADKTGRWRHADGDTVIRVLAAIVVLAVAAFAAIVSYSHIFELGRHHGQDGTAARLLPLSVDGLIASASLVMLYAARNDITLRRVSWPRVMLWLGIGATVAANVLYGLPFGLLAAVISAWPAVAFVGSVEMAVRFARDTRRDDSGGEPPVTPAAGAPVTAVTRPAVTSDKPQRKPVTRKPVTRGLAAAEARALAERDGVSVRTVYRRHSKAKPS